MADNPTMYQRLRQFLRKDVKGKFTNAVLEGLAAVDGINAANLLAARKNMAIWTAEQQYLDKLTSAIGVKRPAGTGIDDDSYRRVAIAIDNSKTVANVFLQVLELFYGLDAIRANVTSSVSEPFFLEEGMDLIVSSDADKNPLVVSFTANDFQNMSAATAIEVANVISRAAVQAGSTVTAQSYLDASSGLTFLKLFSGTRGARSSITILGGLAQNVFKFPELRPTTQASGTQFSISPNGSFIRFTWTSGPDPTLQNISEGDYVILTDPPFSADRSGTFTITKVSPDVVGSGYFEIVNPLVQTSSTVTLSNADQMRFYYPKKSKLTDLTRYANLYEVNPYEIVIYIPATTQIVKRDLLGSWHLHLNGGPDAYISSYMYNPKGGMSISNVSCKLNQTLVGGQPYAVVTSSTSTTNFPDDSGFVVLDFGTSQQEGPIRYLGRPSATTLLLDASYTMKHTHVNPDVTLVRTTKPYAPLIDGSDYATYLTGTVQGRIEAEALCNDIAASGIFVNIVVVYPNGPGLNSVVDVYAGDAT